MLVKNISFVRPNLLNEIPDIEDLTKKIQLADKELEKVKAQVQQIEQITKICPKNVLQ